MQSGASQCTWDKVNSSCSIQAPPTDPAFTILIALLTMIMTIPIVMILHFILQEYAGVWPGSRGFEDDVCEEGKKTDEGVKEPRENVAVKLRNAFRQSDYGEVIKKGIRKGGMAGRDAAAEESQMVYAGKINSNVISRSDVILTCIDRSHCRYSYLMSLLHTFDIPFSRLFDICGGSNDGDGPSTVIPIRTRSRRHVAPLGNAQSKRWSLPSERDKDKGD